MSQICQRLWFVVSLLRNACSVASCADWVKAEGGGKCPRACIAETWQVRSTRMPLCPITRRRLLTWPAGLRGRRLRRAIYRGLSWPAVSGPPRRPCPGGTWTRTRTPATTRAPGPKLASSLVSSSMSASYRTGCRSPGERILDLAPSVEFYGTRFPTSRIGGQTQEVKGREQDDSVVGGVSRKSEPNRPVRRMSGSRSGQHTEGGSAWPCSGGHGPTSCREMRWH